MPPIRITKVWPAATMPTKEATSSTASMPVALANPGRTIPPDDEDDHPRDRRIENAAAVGVEAEPHPKRQAGDGVGHHRLRLTSRPTAMVSTTATIRKSPS